MEMVTIYLPWKPLDVVFVGDVQWIGHKKDQTASGALQETIDQARAYQKEGHSVKLVGMGDYVDTFSPSNRGRLNAANLYTTVGETIEDAVKRLVQELALDFFSPTVGMWAGLIEGHHWQKYETGITSDMDLATRLKAKFLGSSALIRFCFRRTGTRSEIRTSAVLFVHHGTGSGQTGYYPLTRLEKVAAQWEGVDVFAMGHTVKQAVEVANKGIPRWSPAQDLSHRKIILIGTGGYSKTYVVGAKQGNVPRGGYAEQGLMSLAIVGSPVLHITPRLKHGGYIWLDITAEA